MSSKAKQTILVCSCLVLIALSCLWIYSTQTGETKVNTALHQRIGEVMAEQTAALIGNKGKVVTLAIPAREWPELKIELEAFHHKLHALGNYDTREYELDPKDQPKYSVGSGLSGRRYLRTVKKNEKADVFVSFIGAPELDEDEVKELVAMNKPKLLALSRSTENLPALFKDQLIAVAVVSRFQFPSPAPENPKTPQEWFTKRYQVVSASNLKALPD